MSDLQVLSVAFNVVKNSVVHHTDKFALTSKGDSILRRGQVFYINLTLNRPFKWDKDLLKLFFNFGSDPRVTRNTKGVVTIGGDLQSLLGLNTGWLLQNSSQIQTNKTKNLEVQLSSPFNIPAGRWLFQIENFEKFATPVYFLFNPWLKEDTVYMPDTDLLDEYVLSDTGKIWVGAIGSCRGREWIFGQFDKYVLPACMLVFERAKVHPTARGNPVRVARVISKLVNANDDRGVIVGKWSAPYENGTPPAAWTGSAPILRQFVQSGEPVRYGQCWVFAAVVATMCRALGIPCRVVSNLVSAHDANASLTIDRYYDPELNAISPDDREDSIWNFHVWNDVWMARPDLPSGYGGWQAIDATPQETSDGYYQCGPASLRAIRTGEIGYPYDSAFMYASVNADIIRWKEDPSSDLGYVRIQTFKDHIGKMILTKKPFIFDANGDRDKEDITEQYKPKEGTSKERLVAYNAAGKSDEAKRFYDLPDKNAYDVEFTLKTLERIMIGDDYNIVLIINNKSDSKRSVKALLSSTSVFYTGVSALDVKSASLNIILPPKSREELSLKVTAFEYLPLLVEYGIMKISALCSVCETKQTWAAEDDFQVLKPNLIVTVENSAVLSNPVKIRFQMKNPLKMTLTKCILTYEISGLVKYTTLKIQDTAAETVAEADDSFIPKKSGTFRVVATFFSKQLYDVTGTTTINIE